LAASWCGVLWAGETRELISKQTTSGSTLALQVDGEGKVRFDAIAKQGHRDGRTVQTSFKDLVPLALRADSTEATLAMERPSEDDVAATTEKTKAAFEKLVMGKIKAANPKHVPQGKPKETYIRYTAGTGQGVDGNSQRIIKMVDVVEDPLEPPKFKGKKVPRGPPSPPAPILRSPPRKVSAQEQKDWMIPPCVSNWKNNKGYTIPLDKRLAADGRGLQDVCHHLFAWVCADDTGAQVQINDRFATLSESLYVADRHAREEVRARAQMQQRLAQKEKEQKEEALRQMAQEAHAAAHAASLGRPRVEANVSGALAGYGSDDSDEEGSADAPTPPRRAREGSSEAPVVSRRVDPEEEEARKRDEMRRERHKEREREMRMSNMGTEQRARVLARCVATIVSWQCTSSSPNAQSAEPRHLGEDRPRSGQADDEQRVDARLAPLQQGIALGFLCRRRRLQSLRPSPVPRLVCRRGHLQASRGRR
jgi:SNW domain-containing protein 1